MYIPKKYGQSRVDKCPFCNKQATSTNNNGVPVCRQHKTSQMRELKCLCGSSLEQRTGKWGPFFTCYRCGNINMKKALEINEGLAERPPLPSKEMHSASNEEKIKEKKISDRKPKETEVRSDDPRYFD